MAQLPLVSDAASAVHGPGTPLGELTAAVEGFGDALNLVRQAADALFQDQPALLRFLGLECVGVPAGATLKLRVAFHGSEPMRRLMAALGAAQGDLNEIRVELEAAHHSASVSAPRPCGESPDPARGE